MLKKKHHYTVAVVGATGVVGKELLEILGESDFPIGELVLLASERSEGEKMEFRGGGRSVKRLTGTSFTGADIVFFTAGSSCSAEFVPAAVKAGAVVIDNSRAFRMDPSVPLVVPEVNAHAAAAHAGIIASPGCSTIGLVLAIKPIHEALKTKRIVLTAFQSASGVGKNAVEELAGQTVALLNFRDVEKKSCPHQLAFNCVPQINTVLENGYTSEEADIADETAKIMEDDSIQVTATGVRVPVFRGLSGAVNIELENKTTANEIRSILSTAAAIVVYDDPKKNIYPTPIDVAGKNEVYVGRIRDDNTVSNGINLWLALDEIRRGAALNMVRIAELLIQ